MKQTVLSTQFVKPYSRGQITLPKNFRQKLGITSQTWLKLVLLRDRILLEPAERQLPKKERLVIKPKVSGKNYLKLLDKIEGSFGEEVAQDNKKIRKEAGEITLGDA